MIELSVNALKPSGLFIANLDLSNIVINGTDSKAFLRKIFREYNIGYDGKKRIVKHVGGAAINFNLKYLGADDEFGPNYTGQDSVTSYYSM